LPGGATFYLSWLVKLSEVIRRGMLDCRAHAQQLFGRNGVKKVSTLATGNCLWLAQNIGDLWIGVRGQRSVASASAYGQICAKNEDAGLESPPLQVPVAALTPE
jgi:hypothetical protein